MTKFCPSCEEDRQVKTITRDATYTVRDRKITVRVTTEVCSTCGQPVGSDEQDQAVLDAVHAEYRRQADLLTPQRIEHVRVVS
jgi:YgiT-type zinc finger domain-containing protein